ncbi:MAG: prepilin-type N-terminal cleavage/methylation domain-containing protein [Patescibacteria group bacterium]|nr:prepilin-type N-terminal cleavage/methylation domain-containing protein [Patescibacteria group bacterium]
MKFKNQKGFTLIELLVVIVIIGILATLTTVALSTARVKARDAKRISDIKQMQTALELYYNEENTYPPTSALDVGKALVGAVSGKTFMGKIPAGPNTGETYTYAQINSGTSYTLGYVLEKPVNEFAAGAAIAVPGSINNQCTPNCSGKVCGSNGCGGTCAPNNCSGATPYCKTNGTACVDCNTNSDCSDTPATPYCASNVCSTLSPCSDTVSAGIECNSSSAYGAICGGGTLFCKAGEASCGNANLVAAPSGCTTVNNCSCGTDSLKLAWKTSNTLNSTPYIANDLYIGYNNINGNASPTEATYAPSTDYPAANFCSNLSLTFNGVTYDDWYLPSRDELCAMVRSGQHCSSLSGGACEAGSGQTAARTPLNGCTNTTPFISGAASSVYYRSSTEVNASYTWIGKLTDNVDIYDGGYQKTDASSAYVRCIRRF